MGFATPNQIDEVFDNLAQLLESIPFDLEQSDLASFYYARRNPYNLSLGDCACLALAEALKEDILTAEHAWKKIPDLPFKVVLIRKHDSS
jgi:PIN domain nuclease of toxin-antitoxin system